MKNLFKPLALALIAITTFSCEDDDQPEVINEEEVITTVTLTLTRDNERVVLTSTDLDGDGPNAPTVTVSGALTANSTYSGEISFLNETEDPVEDITVEVNEEADEHQVFYTSAADLNVSTEATNNDSNGNPLGTTVNVTTGDASTGNYTITLRHEPNKPNSGLATAGGETDIEVVFMVTVE